MINCSWLLSSFFLTRTYRSFAAWPKVCLLSMDKERFLHFSDSAVGLNLLEQLFFWTWDFPGRTPIVSYLILLQQALGIVFVLFCFFPGHAIILLPQGEKEIVCLEQGIAFLFNKPFEQCPLAGNFSSLCSRVEKLWVLKGLKVGIWEGGREGCASFGDKAGHSAARSCSCSLPVETMAFLCLGWCWSAKWHGFLTLLQAFLCPLYQGTLGRGRWCLLASESSMSCNAMWSVAVGQALWCYGRDEEEIVNSLFSRS